MKILKPLLIITFAIWIIIPATAFAQLADSPWPVFHGNSKLTGQSVYDTSKVNGSIKWKFKAEGMIETSPVIDKDGNIYFADHKCNLFAVTKDGKEKWKFNAGMPVTSKEWGGEACSQSSPALSADGSVYFLPMTGNLFAVDKDGKEKWRYPIFTFKNSWPTPMIGPDGTIYVGSESYPPTETGKPEEKPAYLYAINPNGTLKWTFGTGGNWVTNTPSIGDDDTVHISANDLIGDKRVNTVFALNQNDGSVKWKFAPPDGVLEGSIMIGPDSTMYFPAKGEKDPRNANFYALNPGGTLKWKVPISSGASLTPGLSPDGKKIYFGDWGGIFYAFDTNGNKLWRVDTPGGKGTYESLSSSPAIGKDGTIYLGTTANAFFAYSPEGKLKWKIDVRSGVDSSPAIGSDGTVYFTSVEGELYAVGGSTLSNKMNLLGLVIAGLVIIMIAVILFIKKKKNNYHHPCWSWPHFDCRRLLLIF